MHPALLGLSVRCQTCLQYQSFAFGSHCLATELLKGGRALTEYSPPMWKQQQQKTITKPDVSRERARSSITQPASFIFECNSRAFCLLTLLKQEFLYIEGFVCKNVTRFGESWIVSIQRLMDVFCWTFSGRGWALTSWIGLSSSPERWWRQHVDPSESAASVGAQRQKGAPLQLCRLFRSYRYCCCVLCLSNELQLFLFHSPSNSVTWRWCHLNVCTVKLASRALLTSAAAYHSVTLNGRPAGDCIITQPTCCEMQHFCPSPAGLVICPLWFHDLFFKLLFSRLLCSLFLYYFSWRCACA